MLEFFQYTKGWLWYLQIFQQEVVLMMCFVGSLWISEAFLSKMEKFQCSSALLNIKYNCAVLFLKVMYWLFIYASKYFLIDRHYKTLDRIYWFPRKWQNLLNFLQGVDVEYLYLWVSKFVKFWNNKKFNSFSSSFESHSAKKEDGKQYIWECCSKIYDLKWINNHWNYDQYLQESSDVWPR